MNIHQHYIVATLPDGTLYKIPAAVIFNKLRIEMCAQMGITLQQASLQITPEKVEEENLVQYAYSLDYHHVMPDAILLTRSPGMSFKEGWDKAHKEILSQNQIDNLLVNKP